MVFGIDDAIMASVGGALVSGIFGAEGQSQTNAHNLAIYEDSRNTNIAEAEKQRQWESQMSSTAYQRAVEDMRKAGINPMLAYMKGGASTPGGATASAPSAPRLESGLSKGVSSAVEGLRMSNEIKRLVADTDNTNEDTELKKLQQKVAEQTKEKETANAVVAKRNADQAELDLKLRKEGFDAELRNARLGNRRAKVNEKTFVPDTIADKASSYLAPVGSALGLGRFFKGFGGATKRHFENTRLHLRGSSGMEVE